MTGTEMEPPPPAMPQWWPPVAPRRPRDGALLSLAGVAISTYAKYCYNKLQKAALTGAKKVPPGPTDVFLPAEVAPWWGQGQAAPETGQGGATGPQNSMGGRCGMGTST